MDGVGIFSTVITSLSLPLVFAMVQLHYVPALIIGVRMLLSYALQKYSSFSFVFSTIVSLTLSVFFFYSLDFAIPASNSSFQFSLIAVSGLLDSFLHSFEWQGYISDASLKNGSLLLQGMTGIFSVISTTRYDSRTSLHFLTISANFVSAFLLLSTIISYCVFTVWKMNVAVDSSFSSLVIPIQSVMVLMTYLVISQGLGVEPLQWLFNLINRTYGGSTIIVYWFACTVIFTILARRIGEVRISWLNHFAPSNRRLILRKAFHFGAVVMFLAPLFLGFVGLRLASVAICGTIYALAQLDILRAVGLIPQLNKVVEHLVDHRDSGIFVFSHQYLLVGCVIPLFLGCIQVAAANGAGIGITRTLNPLAAALLSPFETLQSYILLHPFSENPIRFSLMCVSGIITVGVGDSFAAITGIWAKEDGGTKEWGEILQKKQSKLMKRDAERRLEDDDRPSWMRKTVFGTLGFFYGSFIVYVLLSLSLFFFYGYWKNALIMIILHSFIISFIGAITETFVEISDNVVTPIVIWIASALFLSFLS